MHMEKKIENILKKFPHLADTLQKQNTTIFSLFCYTEGKNSKSLCVKKEIGVMAKRGRSKKDVKKEEQKH